jgi:hypothetical protein
MSYGTDALYEFAAQDPRRISPQVIPKKSSLLAQNVLGSAALGFVAAMCLWTIGSHLAGGEAATFEARFGSLPAATSVRAAPRMTVVQKGVQQQHAGFFEAQQLSRTRGTFAGGHAPAAQHLTPSATSGAPQLQAAISPRQTARDLAQGAPLPIPRPSSIASLHDAATSEKPLSPAPKVVTEDKATVLALISNNKTPSLFQKLFGKPKAEGPMLAYASADGDITGSVPTILFDGKPKYDQWTAVYDISARKVYLPDGSELEAHSGLGKKMDDPRHVDVKMHGATPPHVYDLTPREALFHGDEALRMTPVGGDGRIFGRRGLLTHSYLLGPRGDSNGCVSFKNYAAFLRAYKTGMVKRMVVVGRLA